MSEEEKEWLAKMKAKEDLRMSAGGQGRMFSEEEEQRIKELLKRRDDKKD